MYTYKRRWFVIVYVLECVYYYTLFVGVYGNVIFCAGVQFPDGCM